MKTVLSIGVLLLSIWTQQIFAQFSQSNEFTFTGSTDWYAEDLAQGADGQILHLVRQQQGFFDKTLILSTDTSGQIAWARVWGNDEELLRPRKILPLNNGDLIVAATYFNPFQGGAEMALLYLSSDGSFQRQAVYATIAAENIWDIVVADNGNLYVLGDISADDGIASLLLELNTQGQVVRQLTLKENQFTYYTYLALAPDGGLVLSGRNGASGGVNRSIISRLDSNWNVLWTSEGSQTDLQTFGHHILSVEPDGTCRQLVRSSVELWLVEYDAQGNVTQETWLGDGGEPTGFSTLGNNYLISTLNGSLIELSEQFELSRLQYRSSDFGSLETKPIITDNNSIVTIGHSTNEDGQFIVVQQKGAAELAPGCVGYYGNPMDAPESSDLVYASVHPTIGTPALSLGALDLAFGTLNSPTIVNTCTQECAGAPDAAFTISQNGLSLTVTLDEETPETDYNWELSNGQSYFGTSLNLGLTEEGMYELCLTSSNDCGQSQSCQSFTVTINSTDDLQVQNLQIAPNPAREYCQFLGLTPGQYQLTIFDALGKVVRTEERFFQPSASLALHNLVAGQYFVQLTNSENRYVARLIKS